MVSIAGTAVGSIPHQIDLKVTCKIESNQNEMKMNKADLA
jgi:hypothetical protein